jgi:hypothetical protein
MPNLDFCAADDDRAVIAAGGRPYPRSARPRPASVSRTRSRSHRTGPHLIGSTPAATAARTHSMPDEQSDLGRKFKTGPLNLSAHVLGGERGGSTAKAATPRPPTTAFKAAEAAKILFKVSVRLQGGPKRAAHAADQGVMTAPAGSAGAAMPTPVGWRVGRTTMGRRDAEPQGGHRRMCAAADRCGLGDAAELPRRAAGRVPGLWVLAVTAPSGGGAPAPGWPAAPRHPRPGQSRADPAPTTGGSRATGWA